MAKYVLRFKVRKGLWRNLIFNNKRIAIKEAGRIKKAGGTYITIKKFKYLKN